MPELTPSRIPAGMYPSLLRNYETVGLYNFAVAHADLPDDFVYQVVRAVFENQDEMILRRRKQFLPTSIGTHLFRSIQGPSVTTDRSGKRARPTNDLPSRSRPNAPFLSTCTAKRRGRD